MRAYVFMNQGVLVTAVATSLIQAIMSVKG
jgi:hypothetical protein